MALPVGSAGWSFFPPSFPGSASSPVAGWLAGRYLDGHGAGKESGLAGDEAEGGGCEAAGCEHVDWLWCG